MSNPLEAKLRPAVELIPATAYSVASALVIAGPVWLTPAWTERAAVSLTLLGLSALNGHRAWQVLRYRRNLRVLKPYVLRPEQIPWSRQTLFLGMGFRWTAQHTQRLAETALPHNLRYLRPNLAYRLARRFEARTEHLPQFSRLRALTGHPAWWNPAAPLPDVGGNPALHGVEPDEHPIHMSLSTRVAHTLVLGTTRVGKTRLAEILITQDIRRGDVVICFDPKGDKDLLIRMYAEARRNGRPFYVFHLGYPALSARYNPIGAFSRVTEVATRTADPLPSEGNSAAFKEFVWRFVNVLAKTMVALGERPDFAKIYAYAVDTENLAVRYLTQWLNKIKPGWEDSLGRIQKEQGKELAGRAQKTNRSLDTLLIVTYIREQGLREPLVDALLSILSNDRTYFEKLVSSLYPLLEKLTTGRIAELISPDYLDLADPRPIIDWMSVINQGAVVYIGLDSLSDSEVAGAVGTAMFADLTSVAGQIYKFGVGAGQLAPGTRKLALHADEFNELVGDAFIPMVNKAGGAGYQVTAYTQTWDDVEAKIGSAPKAAQIGGNFNSRVFLRVENTTTAELLTEKLPQVNVATIQPASGASDTNDPTDFAEFAARNEDKINVTQVPMLTPADLIQLPKGQAFALIEGGQLYKIRIPLPDNSGDPMLPASLAEMVQDMERQAAERAGNGPPKQSIVQEGRGSGW